MKTAILSIQSATFMWLGTILALEGEWKLATAQWMLAVVQFLVYS